MREEAERKDGKKGLILGTWITMIFTLQDYIHNSSIFLAFCSMFPNHTELESL